MRGGTLTKKTVLVAEDSDGFCFMDGCDYLRRFPADRNIEPNVHITPDGNGVSFMANFFGTPQVYLVDARPGDSAILRYGARMVPSTIAAQQFTPPPPPEKATSAPVPIRL